MGGEGGPLNPPLRYNCFTFMEKKQIELIKLIKLSGEINNVNVPFVNLNPLSRNPGSTPVLIISREYGINNQKLFHTMYNR